MFEKLVRRLIKVYPIKLSDFSKTPGGRTREDGEFSAEEFRDEVLIPAIKKHKYVSVDLDGTRGIGSNFLEEVFGGLIRKGFKYTDLMKFLKIKTVHTSLFDEVQLYLKGMSPAAKTEKIPFSLRSDDSEKLIRNSTNPLAHNEWVSLGIIRRPEKKIEGYVYSHESRCNGSIVAFVPFRKLDYGRVEVLIRFEAVPCWDFDTPVPSSFTGGIDDGLSPKDCVIKELREEAGYEVDSTRLISVGQSYGTKSSDTIYHLFGVDLTGLDQQRELTVESELEKSSFNKWVPISETSYLVPDPFFGLIMFRMKHLF